MNSKHQFWFRFTLILLPVLVILAVHGPRLQNTIDIHNLPKLDWPSNKPSQQQISTTAEIPNIVHFVHLVPPEDQRPQDQPILYFPFRQFIAIYSASFHLTPTTIYIHTNIPADKLPQALRTGNTYVQLIRSLPHVIFNPVSSPTHTSTGLEIPSLPNQSDFVRTEQLLKTGGIYLDDDSYVLRDLTPFRTAGFDFIAGETKITDLCPGAFLTQPGSGLVTAYHALQDKTFDGTWGAHAIDLLSTLARDFANVPRAVLVLPQDSFFPLSWFDDDMKTLYEPHMEEAFLGAPEPAAPYPGFDPRISNKEEERAQAFTKYVAGFDLHPPRDWQRDWRASYILHGWNSAFRTSFSDEAREEVFGSKGEFITLEYVLGRSSNFARAVYPAVRHAVDRGLLEVEG